MITLVKAWEKKGVITKSAVATSTIAAEAIIDAEWELNIDLVAMSTHGRSGISRWAYGGVTEKVLRAR